MDVSGDTPILVFNYLDSNKPLEEPPVYQPPLSKQIAELKYRQELIQKDLDELILGSGSDG